MQKSLTFGLVLILIFIASPVLGGEEQTALLFQRWASWFSDQEQQASAKPITTSLYQSTIKPTLFVLPSGQQRLRDQTPETEQPRTSGLLSSMTWMKGMFVTETEIANNHGGAGWLQEKIAGDTRGEAENRMLRIGLIGTTGTIRYGMAYRTAGQAFYNGPDQTMREAWGEWTHGWTTLRSTLGQQWNNVAGDATRSRLEQTYGRVGLSWNRPAWPSLTLTYARNSLQSALDPVGIAPQRMSNHTFEAALAYNTTSWNARLASSYLVGTDLYRNGAGDYVSMQVFTAAFRPLNTLTIAPTLVYRSEQQE